MPHKVSIYLDDETHRLLKAAAGKAGVSLSAFMADAATEVLRRPDRRRAQEALLSVRRTVAGRVCAEEIAEWRTEGTL